MATFHAGQKTHQAALPQQIALEFESADTPRIGDETGLEDRIAVPGVEHLRGETPDASPGVGRVTPNPGVGEPGRKAHPVVFVLDKHGAPLMPSSPARARKLLAKKRAVVARHTPFVIRLKDRTAAEASVAGVELGIDPGSKHTGISVFASTGDGDRRGMYSIELVHRGGRIRDKLTSRAAYRRGRRTRNLRYRAPRFLNRTRPKGWLAPSLRHRVETTMSWCRRLARWAPVTAVHVERVAFDTHAISAGKPLEGAEYRYGTLHGTEVREYLLATSGRACTYCGITGVPLNIDHIHPRSRGGSDRVSNLCVACIPCNQAKNNIPVEDFLRNSPQRLARVLAQATFPLRDAAAVNATRWELWRALDGTFLTVHTASGGRTKWNRIRTGLPKTHTLDALCVGVLNTVTQHPSTVLAISATGRGTCTRTRTDKYGFPRLRLPRQKTFFGFRTGDLGRAVVPHGKKAGTYTGRIAVRNTGSFNIRTANGLVQGIGHKHFRLLQQADGYAYASRPEGPLT
ncbi:RNA-guided endonuclease IscB [Streptomyces sp. RKAG337]|uniref:RNA-guided endonuclease IscB n=1 Tax=Streptomyces sp. RKAG337 TaxID=2893404 RepID=UPI0020342E01|nr:RNA-guided endonuclease IscB [Streptomyces sp. RKAG337]MCM2428673.1 RNA-guided endonuclease IscB [Streptomyces sp. RKAG337]